MNNSLSRRRFLHLVGGTALAAGFSGGVLRARERRIAKQLVKLSEEPWNAEADPKSLVTDRITPLETFYVRCNGNVPKIDPAEYRLKVDGLVEQPLSLSLDDLRNFPTHTVEGLLMCAGNRRNEFNAEKKVSGLAWGAGALGNGKWAGIAMADVLKAAGVKPEAKHACMEGLDEVREKDKPVTPFGGSIPLDRAMLSGDVPGALLVWEMNGEPLLPEHGSPLRVFVPGMIGARGVKWLGKITLSERESTNPFLQTSYKLVQTADKAEAQKTEPIYTFPVNGVICTPQADAELKPGKIRVAGYAIPSGQAGVTVKSAVLRAGDREWPVKLLGEAKPFAWQLWEVDIELPTGKHELALTVTDTSGATQPEKANWNYRGYLNNARHRVAITVV